MSVNQCYNVFTKIHKLALSENRWTDFSLMYSKSFNFFTLSLAILINIATFAMIKNIMHRDCIILYAICIILYAECICTVY